MPEIHIKNISLEQYSAVIGSDLRTLPVAQSLARAFADIVDPTSIIKVEIEPDKTETGENEPVFDEATSEPPLLYVIGRPNNLEMDGDFLVRLLVAPHTYDGARDFGVPFDRHITYFEVQRRGRITKKEDVLNGWRKPGERLTSYRGNDHNPYWENRISQVNGVNPDPVKDPVLFKWYTETFLRAIGAMNFPETP